MSPSEATPGPTVVAHTPLIPHSIHGYWTGLSSLVWTFVLFKKKKKLPIYPANRNTIRPRQLSIIKLLFYLWDKRVYIAPHMTKISVLPSWLYMIPIYSSLSTYIFIVLALWYRLMNGVNCIVSPCSQGGDSPVWKDDQHDYLGTRINWETSCWAHLWRIAFIGLQKWEDWGEKWYGWRERGI